jgi:N-acetyl-gamma-glutamyl-phosphate reductase
VYNLFFRLSLRAAERTEILFFIAHGNTMNYKVFIDGNSGTTGLRIEELLTRAGGFEIVRIAYDERRERDLRLEKIDEADVTVLCLPDDEAAEIAALAPSGARIIDASTAHRVADGWVYGLPELRHSQREGIREANRVAVPGCHATGFLLLAVPLIDMGIVEADYPFSLHTITGYSGGGKSMIAAYENTREAALSVAGRDATQELPGVAPREYALTQTHKHLPEMTKMAGLTFPPIFIPHVSSFYSGLSAVLPLHRRMMNAGLAELRRCFEERYAAEPFVTVQPAGADPENGYLSAAAMSGRNDLEIFITGGEERIVLTARYDNLGKGASGAALQCLNIMLGFTEERGLL